MEEAPLRAAPRPRPRKKKQQQQQQNKKKQLDKNRWNQRKEAIDDFGRMVPVVVKRTEGADGGGPAEGFLPDKS